MAFSSTPKLAENGSYLWEILGHDKLRALKFCEEFQAYWHSTLSNDCELDDFMKKWKKDKAIYLVSVSDKFGGSPPGGEDKVKNRQLLLPLFDRPLDVDPDPQMLVHTPSSDAETDRGSEKQKEQHMMAYLILMNCSSGPLSEELIKRVHRTLMNNLHKKDKKIISAGEYRSCPMSADVDHDFIKYEDVPQSMSDLVKQYNQKQGSEHHIFELAGWLLIKMLHIHPFEDGNGRLSRLLWCYSLQKDGLPFPITPFPGSKKAYTQYIHCINRDRSQGAESKHMTTLTLISSTKAWMNFIDNLKSGHKEKISDWLKESGNLLD